MNRSRSWRVHAFAALLIFSLPVLQIPQPIPVTAQTDAAAIDWPAITLQSLNLSLTGPVHLTNAGDGSGRLFIVEQAGRIRIYENGALRASAFLDIRGDVLAPPDPGAGNEEGMLSVAFPPGYADKGYFYVYYTNQDSNNVVARFYLDSVNRADEASGEIILEIPHPGRTNHNGGQLAFGPDGYLYIATGDGGGAGDPDNNAQDPSSLLGKILRIDPDEPTRTDLSGMNLLYLPRIYRNATPGAATLRYSIPPNNPFVGQAGYRPEIWALGLRNPWRYSFDRLTGDLYIGDVGQGLWEEINFQPAASPGGQNYGWRIMEGMHCYNSASCNQTGLTLPIFEYTHDNDACSVTGGVVYRGQDYPSLQGIYLYADWCNGNIWGLAKEATVWQNHLFNPNQARINSFGEDEDGELYVVVRDGGVYRITVP